MLSPEEARFVGLRNWWRRETANLTDNGQVMAHQAYCQIIAMGQPALRFILEEFADLAVQPAPWWRALVSISGVNAAAKAATADEARQAWLRWGCDQGFLAVPVQLKSGSKH